jgi:hypothetical protein
MTEKRKREATYTGDEEIIERNIERSREVIEARRQSENAGKGRRPDINDAQSAEDTIPGQTDVPAGGTSNPNFAGGSSKRHKNG